MTDLTAMSDAWAKESDAALVRSLQNILIGRCHLDEEEQAVIREAARRLSAPQAFDMLAHLKRQREWSEKTFGPGARTAGVVDHIRKELREIEADPADIAEWIDVAILALDGAWRAGYQPQQIIDALVAKQTKNEGRIWPDWRTMPADKAIEHDRLSAPASADEREEIEKVLIGAVVPYGIVYSVASAILAAGYRIDHIRLAAKGDAASSPVPGAVNPPAQ